MVQTRSELKRTEILRRAAGVFRQKGFHGAGMREIARGLDLAPGALYYYFESKEELLYACQMLSLKGLLSSARRILQSDASPEEKLRALVHSHLAHILHEVGGGLAHMEFHALPRARLDEVVEKRDAYERIMRKLIREGIASGAFRRVDPKFASLALLGSLNWTVVWWRPEGKHELSAVAGQFAEIMIEGLRK